jgi:hypothetical protein
MIISLITWLHFRGHFPGTPRFFNRLSIFHVGSSD